MCSAPSSHRRSMRQHSASANYFFQLCHLWRVRCSLDRDSPDTLADVFVYRLMQLTVLQRAMNLDGQGYNLQWVSNAAVRVTNAEWRESSTTTYMHCKAVSSSSYTYLCCTTWFTAVPPPGQSFTFTITESVPQRRVLTACNLGDAGLCCGVIVKNSRTHGRHKHCSIVHS